MRLASSLALAALFSASAGSASAQSAEIAPAWRAEPYRQFDFWIGSWDVNLRMIQPDHSWKDSVQAKVEIYSILEGKAILELWDSPGIKGFSLRYFDPEKQKWVLYLNWPGSNQSSLGSLEGEFRHGRGEFFAGPPVGSPAAQAGAKLSRYTFCDISAESLRWDDAYSTDGGQSWTPNWIMEFSRTAPRASWPLDALGHTFATGGRCSGEAFDALNSLPGDWLGEFTLVQGRQEKRGRASLRAFHVLDGCSVLRFLTLEVPGGETLRSFGLLTYNAASGLFEELSLDGEVGSAARVQRGQLLGDRLTLSARGQHKGQPMSFRHAWGLPLDQDRIELETASSRDGEHWEPALALYLKRVDSLGTESPAPGATGALNSTCPRSGKPVSLDSLTEYRGQLVGFCNTHCRDEFAADPEASPEDRAFFDRLIDAPGD